MIAVRVGAHVLCSIGVERQQPVERRGAKGTSSRRELPSGDGPGAGVQVDPTR
jgi:hypothetical protein